MNGYRERVSNPERYVSLPTMAPSPPLPESVMTTKAIVAELSYHGTEGLSFSSDYDLPDDRARIPPPR